MRNELNSFINFTGYKNETYKNDFRSILAGINNRFPHKKAEYDKEIEKKLKAQRIENEKQYRKSTRNNRNNYGSNRQNSFFSLGFEGGTIAKYGARIEFNNNNFVGGFLNVRSSVILDDEIRESSSFIDNKNEAVLGLNFKIAQFLFLNLGGGYGFYRMAPVLFLPDDPNYYEVQLEQVTYYPGYGGITIRLGNTFNIVGGISMPDVFEGEVDFENAEYTYGITINLK